MNVRSEQEAAGGAAQGDPPDRGARSRDPHGRGSQDADPRDPDLRLGRLLDPGSAEDLPGGRGAEALAVRGLIGGSRVIAYATDATRTGGALSTEGTGRIAAAIDRAVIERVPVIGVWQCSGAKLADGVEAMDGAGRMFAAMVRASGRVPQISVVLGPAAGLAAYGPALTDLVVMARQARMFITGPDIVRKVTGQDVDMEALGGVLAHGRKSGVAHLVAEDEAAAYEQARALTGLLARPGQFEQAAVGADQEDLRKVLPGSTRQAYDVRKLIRRLLDAGAGAAEVADAAGGADAADGRADRGVAGGGESRGASPQFVELQGGWARNMVTGFGRLAGHTVGVLANNPLFKAGCLDSLSAEKAARFVRLADALGIPLLSVVDVPGYLPGVQEEWDGVIRRGAKLLHAFAEADVPRVTLITRKSYGGAYIAMNSRSLGATAVFAWPDAEIAIMDADAAVSVLHRRALAAASAEEAGPLRARLVQEQRAAAGGVDRALALGVVDAVIDPEETRRQLVRAFTDAPAGRGHHNNIPL